MVAIKQRNKRPFKEIERIRDALNDSIYIYIFDNYNMFYDKVWFVVFLKDARVTQLPHFCKRSAYIFMFNKANDTVLFHHFFRLFNFFLSILMHFFVNSYLHMSTLYTLIIPNARKFECLKSVQLQPSGTFNAPYFHYVMCTMKCSNTKKTYLFVSVLVL